MNAHNKFASFSEFFPYYLAEHSNAVCRSFHYVGTLLGSTVFLIAIATQNWLLVPLYPLISYSFAWFGHFIFERNVPAAYQYWWWSLMGDYKMCWLWLTGGLQQELQEAFLKFPPNSKNE